MVSMYVHMYVQDLKLSAEEQSKVFMEKAGDDRFRMMLLFLAGITGLQDTQVCASRSRSSHTINYNNYVRMRKIWSKSEVDCLRKDLNNNMTLDVVYIGIGVGSIPA